MSESDSVVCAALPVAMQPKGAGDDEGSIMIHENCTNESFFSHSAHYDSNDVSLNERLNALLLDPKPLKSSVQTELPWLASKQTLRTPPPTASNAEWNRREAELAERERSLRLQSSNTSRVVNFPSCYPLLRHDITNDIPTAAKSAVSFSYATCKALLLALLVTLASEIVWHFSTLVALNSLVLAIVYVFLVPPFVFVFSHLRLYHAVRHNSSLNFYGYFMATTVTSIFILFMTVGIWPENGHGGGIMGIIRAINDHQIAAAITACVTCSMMFVVLLMNMYTTALAVKYYSQATMDRFSPPEAESIRRSVVVERHAQV